MTERTPPDISLLPTDEPLVTATEAGEDAAPAPEKKRLEPTRYGDWELNGKCVDF